MYKGEIQKNEAILYCSKKKNIKMEILIKLDTYYYFCFYQHAILFFFLFFFLCDSRMKHIDFFHILWVNTQNTMHAYDAMHA